MTTGASDPTPGGRDPLPAADPAPSRLDGLESILRRTAGDRPPQLLCDFARAFHFGTPPAYFALQSDACLAQEIISAFDFADGRAPREIRVRIAAGPGTSSLVQVTLRDQPFLLDTVREVLRVCGVGVRRILHPLLRTERADRSRLSAVRPRMGQGMTESFLHFEVEGIRDEALAERIEREIRESLAEAVLASDDFTQMRGALESVARALDAERPPDPGLQAQMAEAVEFLRWLPKGNFIFLGYRAYDIEDREGEKRIAVAPRSGLGILRSPVTSAVFRPVALSALDPAVRERVLRKDFPLIARTNREGRVHRRSRMDYIGIKRLSPALEVAGEHRFLGFFTAHALNQLSSEIPVLRRKLARILERAQVLEGSHDHKQIVAIFDGLPKAELFSTTEEEIARTIETLMGLESNEGVRVTCRRDSLGLGVSLMVILPRDRFNSEVHQRLQKAFAARFGILPTDYRLALSEEFYARLHFYFPFGQDTPLPPVEALERDAREAIRTWDDALRDDLVARFGPERGHVLAERFAGAVPPAYKARFGSAEAVGDVEVFDALAERGGLRVRIEDGPPMDGEAASLIRLYRAEAKFHLSDIMPILTNLGLRVIDEITFHVSPAGLKSIHLHTIRVQDSRAADGQGAAIPAGARGELEEAVIALTEGIYENDPLGALVLRGLSIREVELLRTYIHCFHQLRVPHTPATMISALVEEPGIARSLVAHFRARFRPERLDRIERLELREGIAALSDGGRSAPDPIGEARSRLEALAVSRAGILGRLDRIEDLGRDRIFRGLLELVEATVRTNYYQKGGTLPRIALKVESRRISAMPRPVPLFEIFVHNASMEGVHLRSGKVARGGIRWSDRRDDFRTEILGLMRTQFVKNAVIVPVGSKGGFVLKRPPERGEDLAAQVARQYRALISGLLDLTDNLAGGTVVHPADTLIHDGPDPYLVVAADKGTASFSDLANSIAAEYGFWLGDGFASGGSRGYDHKKEGITARGAWECARSRLREVDIDPDGDVTVVGIGDMSGDVFGNGLLLSQRFRLVAAFDHRHVFLDPSPDPEASFQERRRLFLLPRSSWADYNGARISPGGGVLRRDAKRVALSPQARSLLGIAAEALTGEELVREVLKLPVDLLWNGGIGTYVKAAGESNAEVGDSRNDAVRVDAGELRAKVIAEGGNLGLTQAARIEFALRGGKIDTDFIDNSAGVDLSDHEVNIKIGLDGVLRSGRLDPAERDGLLASLTDEVCALVLRNNREHAQILAAEERASREDLWDHALRARELAEAGLLEARFERFPEAAELRRRAERRSGLVRPELALLLAFTKIEISRALRETGLAETPGFEGYLPGYFPRALRERFADAFRSHPLAREIALSALVNEMVARSGVTFLSRLRGETGAGIEEAVRAWRAADLLLDGRAFVPAVRDLLAEGRISPECAHGLLSPFRRTLADVARALLASWPAAPGGGPVAAGDLVRDLGPAFEEVTRWVGSSAPALIRERAASIAGGLAAAGAPSALAARVAQLEGLRLAVPAIEAARRAGDRPERAAAALSALRGVLRAGDLERLAAELPAVEPDDRIAARSCVAEMEGILVDLAAAALGAPGAHDADPERAAEELLAGRGAALAACRNALPEAGRPIGLGTLQVILGRLRRLARG